MDAFSAAAAAAAASKGKKKGKKKKAKKKKAVKEDKASKGKGGKVVKPKSPMVKISQTETETSALLPCGLLTCMSGFWFESCKRSSIGLNMMISLVEA